MDILHIIIIGFFWALCSAFNLGFLIVSLGSIMEKLIGIILGPLLTFFILGAVIGAKQF